MSLSATTRVNGTPCCSNEERRSLHYCMYHKSKCLTKENPMKRNFIGFSIFIHSGLFLYRLPHHPYNALWCRAKIPCPWLRYAGYTPHISDLENFFQSVLCCKIIRINKLVIIHATNPVTGKECAISSCCVYWQQTLRQLILKLKN